MLNYTMIGTNDLRAAERFYNSFLLPMGYDVTEWKGRLIYFIPGGDDAHNGPGAFYVTGPFDGKPATVGNGAMVAFRLESHLLVHHAYSAGLEAGGVEEGRPGFRDLYGPHFYVGYLRDPDGNKVALFCTNPDEPSRPD
ncbi:VOC family protein [Pseudomonas syringae]|uniref:VOC family protein n=1 Tax=Pseudomonas syringae TaxID=317 RepID=UPI00020984BC|nr:VOC family protein [Pseudomonas syringae]EGH71493.1 hypothetical protein PSYAR_13139 [Pseudomonas syringae pv. aceris str. M302273]